MMVEDQDAELAFVLIDQDQPGLAILDSGCTRTMHGSEWASTFEKSLVERGLSQTPSQNSSPDGLSKKPSGLGEIPRSLV